MSGSWSESNYHVTPTWVEVGLSWVGLRSSCHNMMVQPEVLEAFENVTEFDVGQVRQDLSGQY